MNKQKHSLNNRGAAIITVVLFFVITSVAIAIGLASPVVREYKTTSDFEKSKSAYYLSEAGHEDALYRIKQGITISPQEVLTLDGNTATTTITTIDASNKTINSIGDILKNTRRVKSELTTSVGASFSFGVQAGNGGIELENSSSITGNVYSNGTVSGSGSNLITGSVVSAGPTGSISGVSSGSSAYAHNISSSNIGGNAYYQTISGTTVSGTSYPGSTDQATSSLPITDAMIVQFEADAAAGGTYSSPCIINSPVSWSARKITCSKLEIKDTVTLTGMVWVTGDVEIENAGRIVLAASLGEQSAGIIVDNPSNRTTGSKIIIKNNSTFSGSGTPGSHVLLLSQNNSAELSGNEIAIELVNSASGDILLYASHGKVQIANNSALKEVTAYRVHLKNSANVTYSSGLANALFVGSPLGSWNIVDWKEGQ
ncbi:MAG: hypothetical protein AAB628_01005 [Patescibacteria group bacterium]